MKVTDKEKEIMVIENIIRLLKECLRIEIKNLDYQGMIRTIRDIQKCRKKLRTLTSDEKVMDGA